MPMIGTVGNPVLVDHEPHYAIKNVALIKFPPHAPSNVYIQHLLGGHYFGHITAAKNRGGTQEFISLSDIRNLPIPLPPAALQKNFAARAKTIQSMKENLYNLQANIERLFFSLQQRAFRGEL